MAEQRRGFWLRAGQVVAAGGLLLLVGADLTTGFFESGYFDTTRLGIFDWDYAELLAAALAGLAWLTAHRLGPRLIVVLAGSVSAFSMLVTAVPAVTSPRGGTFGVAETAALLGLLMIVVRQASPWLVPVGGLAVLAAIVTQPVRGGGGSERIILALALALAAAGAAGAGFYLRALDYGRLRQVDAVRAEQRAEFARDLHDFIAHHVTGIVVQAQGARIIAAHDPARVVTALEQIERAGAETMASMRRMVGVLRAGDERPDAPLAPLMGMADLGPLVDGFATSGEVTTGLHVTGRVDDLPVEVTSSVCRVVMEALTNVRRHALRPSRVDVAVRRTDDWVLVRIVDDGQPVRAGIPREPHGFGLVGLTERVGSLGGRIQAGPGIDGGWVVDVSIPLARQPAGRLR
jgi:signal transduction histidine kinase